MLLEYIKLFLDKPALCLLALLCMGSLSMQLEIFEIKKVQALTQQSEVSNKLTESRVFEMKASIGKIETQNSLILSNQSDILKVLTKQD